MTADWDRQTPKGAGSRTEGRGRRTEAQTETVLVRSAFDPAEHATGPAARPFGSILSATTAAQQRPMTNIGAIDVRYATERPMVQPPIFTSCATSL